MRGKEKGNPKRKRNQGPKHRKHLQKEREDKEEGEKEEGEKGEGGEEKGKKEKGKKGRRRKERRIPVKNQKRWKRDEQTVPKDSKLCQGHSSLDPTKV